MARLSTKQPKHNLLGLRFGKLLVKEHLGVVRHGKHSWRCACDCGGEAIVTGADLVLGRKKSCSCLQFRANGYGRMPERKVWSAMIKRCNDPSDPHFKQYGGRGITVCESWQMSYVAFINDMGARPTANHTLERCDNSLGYSPENCVWVTQAEQNRNKRTNRWIEFNGERLVLIDWATKLGICTATLDWRIKHWGIDRALTTDKSLAHDHTNY